MTKGCQLKAAFVIHAVGPYWAGGKREEEKSLLSACREALDLAREKKLKYLALAPLSSADKGYPLRRGAAAVVPLLLTESGDFDRLDIVCADEREQARIRRRRCSFGSINFGTPQPAKETGWRRSPQRPWPCCKAVKERRIPSSWPGR